MVNEELRGDEIEGGGGYVDGVMDGDAGGGALIGGDGDVASAGSEDGNDCATDSFDATHSVDLEVGEELGVVDNDSVGSSVEDEGNAVGVGDEDSWGTRGFW